MVGHKESSSVPKNAKTTTHAATKLALRSISPTLSFSFDIALAMSTIFLIVKYFFFVVLVVLVAK